MTTLNPLASVEGQNAIATAIRETGTNIINAGISAQTSATAAAESATSAASSATNAATSATSAAASVTEAESIKNEMLAGYGYPFTAATAADMTDTTKIYVYVGSETGYTFGDWYYHNGTAWTDGGVYNAIAFNTDSTLTISGAAADAKVTGDEISNMRASYGKAIASGQSPYILIPNQYVKTDGTIANYNNWSRTTPIPVAGLSEVTFQFTNNATSTYNVFYDENMVFVSSFSILGKSTVTVPSNASFAMVSGGSGNMDYLKISGLFFDQLTENVDMTGNVRQSLAIATLPFKLINGYYINNGVITGSPNDSMTDLIPVHGVDSLTVDFQGDGNCRAMYNAFYDENKQYISSFELDYGVLEVDVPDTAYYVGFSGRTDNMAKFSVISPLAKKVEELSQDQVSILPYYESEMETTLASVRALMSEPCLVFPICSDIHMYSSPYVPLQFDNMISNMRYLSKNLRIDGVINLGDNTDGDTVKATSFARAYYMGNRFRSITDKFYFTLGNHDDNRSAPGTTDDFTNAENYQAFYSFVDNTCIFDTTYDGTNFYKDFPNYKIRLISLNAMADNQYKYSTETIAWFGSVVNSTPADYAILVISHLAPYGSLNYQGYASSGANQIASILETYQSNGGTIIAFFFGHTHMDFAATSPFNLIAIASNKVEDMTWSQDDCPDGAIYNPRTPGTATEDLWDIVVIRPTSRRINLVRFGAGSDRSFTY